MSPRERYEVALSDLARAKQSYVRAREAFHTASEQRSDEVASLRLDLSEAEFDVRCALDQALVAHRACLRALCTDVPRAPGVDLVHAINRFWTAPMGAR